MRHGPSAAACVARIDDCGNGLAGAASRHLLARLMPPDGSETFRMLVQVGAIPKIGRIRQKGSPYAEGRHRADQQIGLCEGQHVGAIAVRDVAGQHAGQPPAKRLQTVWRRVGNDQELHLALQLHVNRFGHAPVPIQRQ